MTFNPIPKILKKNTTNILIVSLIIVMMGIGSCATVPRTTLQDRTMFISLGQRSTWEHQILGRQTESFITFGRHARQIRDLMECATLRTDGQALASWHPQRLLTWQQLPRTLDLGSYLKLSRCGEDVYRQDCTHIDQLSIFFQTNTGWDGTTEDGVIL